MPFVDYFVNNFCSKCRLAYSKLLGIKCPQCGLRARCIPRNPKKFRKMQSQMT